MDDNRKTGFSFFAGMLAMLFEKQQTFQTNISTRSNSGYTMNYKNILKAKIKNKQRRK